MTRNNQAKSHESKNLFHLGHHTSQSITTVVAYLIVGIAVGVVLFPLIWIFLTSIKDKSLVYQIPPAWVFTPTLQNYRNLFKAYPFPQYMLNSIFIAGVTTILALIIGSMAAYSMARFNTGGNFFRGWVLNNRTMPPIVVLIPMFMLANMFDLINKPLSLILAYLSFALPFTIWMLIGFFESIPADIEDAALVDGANRIQTLFKIVLPLAAPGIASTGILSFLFSWNEFMFALVLTGKDTRTLPIGVANFMTQRGVEYGDLAAAIAVMIVPVMLLAFSIRGYFVRGLSYGGIK